MFFIFRRRSATLNSRLLLLQDDATLLKADADKSAEGALSVIQKLTAELADIQTVANRATKVKHTFE